MKTVAQLLTTKDREIWSVGPDDSVYHVIELMAEKEIGALLVLKEDQVVGIVSERDYARKVLLKGRSSRETSVSEIMSAPVVFAKPEETIQDCMAMMTARRIRHLPVKEGDALVGMLSIGDLVKAIIADQQELIEQLEQYIRG